MTHEIAAQAARNSKRFAQLEFSRLGKLNVQVVFDEAELSSDAGAKFLYESVYCDRGNAEWMIKEHTCFLNSSRTRCNRFLANQFWLFMQCAAYPDL